MCARAGRDSYLRLHSTLFASTNEVREGGREARPRELGCNLRPLSLPEQLLVLLVNIISVSNPAHGDP